MNDVEFYRHLWQRIAGGGFTPQQLADQVRADGGVDIDDLNDDDLRALVEGRYGGPWEAVGFSSSELLASYSVDGGMESAEQVIGWVFAAFAFADAVRNNHGDWEIQFDIFMNGYLKVRGQLEPDESMHILRRVLCDELIELAGRQGSHHR